MHLSLFDNTKPSDNSEAALLALRLLYEQGHGELHKPWQTAGSVQMYGPPWSSCLNRVNGHFTGTHSKSPDFWHPAMWSRPRLITNNQPVTGDAHKLSAKCCACRGRFYSGLEQLKTFCQPQTLAAFAWDLFTAWQQAGAPRKRQLGISGVKSLW